MPLLASPAPHVGSGEMSPQSSAWKRLLVNSPPAWAASPTSPAPETLPSTTAQRIPPFPWPSPNIQIFSPRGPCRLGQKPVAQGRTKPSSEEEEEIERFLSHCSLDSGGKLGLGQVDQVPVRTPSPRKRGSLATTSYTWTPGQMGSCGANSPTVGSGTPMDSAQRFRSDRGLGETPLRDAKVSPVRFASEVQRDVPRDAPRDVPRDVPCDSKGPAQGEPEVQVPLRSCSCCGRRFRVSRLPVHEEICFRNAHKKRSVFESSRQRCEAVSGRWWNECEDVRSSHAQPSAFRSPQARRDSKTSPGMRRSHSTPLNKSRHMPTSPAKATPSPARPTRQVWSGQKPSPNCSPYKVSASSSRRPRSASEARGHTGGTSSARPARDGRTTTSRRAVSLGRCSSASATGIDGTGSRVRHVQAGCPGTASTTSGHDSGARNLSWGSVPAMPMTPEKQHRLNDLKGHSLHEGSTDGNTQVANGSLLGSIIDDVAQLSAQVERLLSRRKDLLQGAGDLLPSRRSGFACDRSSEVLELSPSDSSTVHGGETCRSRLQC